MKNAELPLRYPICKRCLLCQKALNVIKQFILSLFFIYPNKEEKTIWVKTSLKVADKVGFETGFVTVYFLSNINFNKFNKYFYFNN
jgi:hypothetical protein